MYCKIIEKIEMLPFLLPSRRSNGLYKPCQDAVLLLDDVLLLDAVLLLCAVLKVWRIEFPCDDTVHSKWIRIVITKLQQVRWKKSNRSLPKAFLVGCFVIEGVCTFDTTSEYMEASKASGSGHKHGTGLEYYPPYSINLI